MRASRSGAPWDCPDVCAHGERTRDVTRPDKARHTVSDCQRARFGKSSGHVWNVRRVSKAHVAKIDVHSLRRIKAAAVSTTHIAPHHNPDMPIINAPAPRVDFFTPAQYPPSGTAVDNGKPIPSLFRPLNIRGVEFPNRIWVSTSPRLQGVYKLYPYHSSLRCASTPQKTASTHRGTLHTVRPHSQTTPHDLLTSS